MRQPRAVSPTTPEPPSSLNALEHLGRSIKNGLLSLPNLRQQTLDALAAQGIKPTAVETLDLTDPTTQARLAPTVAKLKASTLAQLDTFWNSPIDGRGFARAEQFPAFLRDSLREELALKIQDNDLHPDDQTLLESALDTRYTTAPQLYELNIAHHKMAGAFVIADTGSGRHLLYVPGRGLEGFASRQQLLRTLPTYMDDPKERASLLATIPIAMQAAAADQGNDIEPEHLWNLTPIDQPLLRQVVKAQRQKQLQDIDSAFALPSAGQPKLSPAQWLENLQHAVDQPEQFGNDGMLNRRDDNLLKRAANRLLPQWYKDAGPAALTQHAHLLDNWHASREQLGQLLGPAESPSAYMRQALRKNLGTDLSISLDPDHLRITTQRSSPLGAGSYTQERTLTELGLSSLAAGDSQPGSDFLLNSTLTYKGRPLNSALAGLTPAYLVTLINKLPAPAEVRSTLAKAFTSNTLAAMNKVMDMREPIEGAYVFTQPDAKGAPQRLIYTPDAPDGVLFRDYAKFNNSLGTPGLADYYQQRASAGAQKTIAARLKALQAGQGKLPEPTLVNPQGLLKLFYDAPLQRRIENVQETTLGKNEMISKLVLDSLELIATGLSAPFVFPGLALGAALSLKDIGLASLTAREGNHDKAIEHAYGAIFNMVGALLDVSGLNGLKKLSTQPATHVPASLNPDQTLKILDQLPPAVPSGMREVTLDGELFLVNQHPNVLGHFELYRQSPAGELTSAAQFAQKGVNGQWARLGLKAGAIDNVPPPSILRDVDVKFDVSNTKSVTYQTDLGGYTTEIKFDFNANSWRTLSGDAVRYDPATDQMKRVTLVDSNTAIDAVKNQAMSDLGLDITMPLSVAPLDRSSFKPVPRTISSIWIGKEMPLDHIKNVGNNASAAAKNIPPLEMTLYLSIADTQQLATTLAQLKQHAPQLKIQNLQETDFYQHFSSGKYHEQFLAESSGPAINNAAAVDTLRYPLIDHVGGIYMDVDDVIPTLPNGLSPLPEDALSVGEGTLLLGEPLSNAQLRMNNEFNNSAFGSRPNNPMLKAISEESFERFQNNRDLFESRPYKGQNSQSEIDSYIHRISQVTGPGVFNTVIKQYMPEFHKYSVLRRFALGEFYMPIPERNAVIRSHNAFQNTAKALNIDTGGAHSWEHTR